MPLSSEETLTSRAEQAKGWCCGVGGRGLDDSSAGVFMAILKPVYQFQGNTLPATAWISHLR